MRKYVESSPKAKIQKFFAFLYSNSTSGRDPESPLLVSQPPLLVLINPHAGRGQSRQVWSRVSGKKNAENLVKCKDDIWSRQWYFF